MKRATCLEGNVGVTTERRTQSASGYRVLMQTRPNVFTHRGGDTIVLERLSDGLSHRGHQVTIDLQGSADVAAFDVAHLFNFATTGLTKQYASRAATAGVPYVVTTLYEDLPQFHRQSHLVAGSLIEYVRGGQRPGSYAVTHQHVSAVEPSSRFPADDIARHAAALMPNGAGEASALVRDFPYAKRIMTVPVGSEIGALCGPELFEQVYGERDFVLCVGRLESRKNQLMLLKALEDSPLTVVLAGGGFSYQPDYEAAIRSFKRRGKTIILGLVDPQMLSSAYAACRVHVLPSWHELPGLVSLEAAARNKNIVVTRTGTTADYVGDRAFYCLPWDSDSILSAVMAAYYSPVREGVVEMAQSYSWAGAVEKTEEVYREVVVQREPVAVSKIVTGHCSQEPVMNGEYSMNKETPNFTEIVERGESAAKSADFETADIYLAEAERLDPHSTRVLKARGAVLLAQMRPAEAMSFFDRALAVEPNEPKLLAGRGMCDLLQNHPDKATVFFERALETEPDYLVALYQLLECSYGLGEYAKALRALTRYLQVKPTDVDIRFCLAGCLFKNGQLEAAQWELDVISQTQPDHQGASELRQIIRNGGSANVSSASTIPTPQIVPGVSGATLRASLSELSERVRSWKVEAQSDSSTVASEAMPTAPTAEMVSDEDVAQAIGRVEDLKRSGEFSAAIEELTQLVGRGALNQPYQEIADCLEAEFTVLGGDLRAAGAKYDEILEANPRCARALCGKGALAAEAQQWKVAEQYFTQAITIDSECDVAYAGMGLCAMTENNVEKAFGFFQASTEKNPENHRALLGLLQTGYPLKRYTEMERMLTAYLDLHPASLDMLYSFAGLLFAQGKVNEARLEIEKILIFEPQHEHALELRGMLDKAESDPAVRH
jgi:tetratricopeptide (TPR) repeat protein/glycosyltransferase involved in cell wall biosynthesis